MFRVERKMFLVCGFIAWTYFTWLVMCFSFVTATDFSRMSPEIVTNTVDVSKTDGNAAQNYQTGGKLTCGNTQTEVEM